MILELHRRKEASLGMNVTQPRIAALLPMRHESKRVPGKNYRPFAGRPLYHHIVSSLLSCPLVSQVVIDTDSPFVIDDASKNFPSVTLFERPPHLRADTWPMNEVLMHTIEQIDADFYLQTHSTNPLLTGETIERSIRSFVTQLPAYDSMFSVTRLQTRLWDQLSRAINHNPSILLRTQDLPPVYEENSCVYLFSRQTLGTMRNRIGQRPLMFEIPRPEAIDIDEEIDFTIAELMFMNRKKSEAA